MKNIKNWLQKMGYEVKDITIRNISGTGRDAAGVCVNTDYTGPYPGKAQHDALAEIQNHIAKYYPDYRVQSRGFYTAIYIYPMA